MKQYGTADIRNISLVGHGHSGKTMLAEAMLVCAGVIPKLGSISSKSTVSDYHPEEQERQISTQATLMHAPWKGRKLNIIDDPGCLDFVCESLGALRASDTAVVVINGSSGLEAGTTLEWRFADKLGVPRFFIANDFDREHIEFGKLVETLRQRFGKKIVPLTLPVEKGGTFDTVIDVLNRQVVTYARDRSGAATAVPAAGDELARADEAHQQFVECVAESDDKLLEKFLETGTLDPQEVLDGLHQALLLQTVIPLFVTSALNNVGVSLVMDFIVEEGLSPLDRATFVGTDEKGAVVELEVTDPDPVLWIFKTMHEPHVGDLSFFRVISGTAKDHLELYNPSRRTTERLGHVQVAVGKTRTTVPELAAGDLGVVAKLKDAQTGDTLCHPKKVVQLAHIDYTRPIIHAAVHLKDRGDDDKLSEGLAALHREDPSFSYRIDPETKETVLSGQGDLHLNVLLARLKSRYNIDLALSEPRIPYRETIKSRGESRYRHKKQSGGAGQFAEVWMRIEPGPRNSGVIFTESLVGQNVDRVFVPSVEKGTRTACEEGILAGYRVVDVKVDFYDGKMHPVDSKDVAFQIAGRMAFREAFESAMACLLEPIYDIEVSVPETCLGDLLGDISSRRGRVLGMESDGGMAVIKAQVPQKELYKYATVVRSLTAGLGSYSESFSHYEEMPRELEQKVIHQSKDKHQVAA